MTDAKTVVIHVSIPELTELRALAFNYARNGSFDNSIAELIEAGFETKMANAPVSFVEKSANHFRRMRSGRVAPGPAR